MTVLTPLDAGFVYVVRCWFHRAGATCGWESAWRWEYRSTCQVRGSAHREGLWAGTGSMRGRMALSHSPPWCCWSGDIGDGEAWEFLSLSYCITSQLVQGHSRELVAFHRIHIAFPGSQNKNFCENRIKVPLICGLGEYICFLTLSCLFCGMPSCWTCSLCLSKTHYTVLYSCHRL